MTKEHEVAPDPAHSEHIPVMLKEVLNGLRIRPGMTAIDCTVGGGGHTAQILKGTAPDGRLLGLDADPAAIRRVTERLASELETGRLTLVQSPFADLDRVAPQHGFPAVDGILLDLGVSSFQLETAARGFSFLYHQVFPKYVPWGDFLQLFYAAA